MRRTEVNKGTLNCESEWAADKCTVPAQAHLLQDNVRPTEDVVLKAGHNCALPVRQKRRHDTRLVGPREAWPRQTPLPSRLDVAVEVSAAASLPLGGMAKVPRLKYRLR